MRATNPKRALELCGELDCRMASVVDNNREQSQSVGCDVPLVETVKFFDLENLL